MNKRSVFATISLICVWIILTENISLPNAIIGMILGIITLRFMSALIPSSKLNSAELNRIKFHKLLTYPFWLIIRIYKDAFTLIKMIFTGAKCGIVKEQVELENEVLRSILADSITLTPGTIFLNQEEKEITFLCMDNENVTGYPNAISGLRSIESKLQKAEIKDKLA